MKNYVLFLFAGILCILFAVSPVNAALNEIHQGNTVFIGEEGLVLSADVFYTSGGAADTQLAYYESGSPVTSGPSYLITPSKTSFFVSSADFMNRQGVWYSYPNGTQNNHMAINVQYPSLALKLYAYRTGGGSFDITNGKIVSGEALDFRIDTNLYPVFSRTGVVASDDGIDINVENQVGATLSSLINCTGASVPITGIHPTASSFFLPSGSVACVWDTGNSAYQTGSYTIWAESDINNMMENLGKITGVTVTAPIGTVQNTETIQAGFTSTPTAVSTAIPTPAITKTPTPAVTETQTQTPAPTAPVQTAAATEKTQTQQQTAQLPQTPLGLVTVLSALIIVSAVLALRKI
ncbi:MAG: DUF3821 domain-containing protein [Methanomicrobiaceae archaeon]|nr:DUF3821 domain-containing protein [Methanomicrobiaceae archaeon]